MRAVEFGGLLILTPDFCWLYAKKQGANALAKAPCFHPNIWEFGLATGYLSVLPPEAK
ncbi:MAG: hypothetical protein MJE68_19770 [Proteobacteria bacterium]|nr:hypothetical protein [Pseudomonadota bacterium]